MFSVTRVAVKKVKNVLILNFAIATLYCHFTVYNSLFIDSLTFELDCHWQKGNSNYLIPWNNEFKYQFYQHPGNVLFF